MARRKPIRLDLACGQSPRDGYTGVDIWPGAEIVHDLDEYPWPWDDRSVDAVHCSHYVEHIGYDRGRDLTAFMDEVWRICRPDATVEIRHPHLQNERAFQDPYHRRYIPAVTWCYYNTEWRKANSLDHYPIHANFEIITVSYEGIDPDTSLRAQEVQIDRLKRNWHEAADTVVILKALK